MNSPPLATAPILVMGVGNLLLGDDGVGVVLARRLTSRPLPAGVEVLDGGTMGLSLLAHLEGRKAVVVLDAGRGQEALGTLSWQRANSLGLRPPTGGLSPHEGTAIELLQAASLVGLLPEESWVGVVQVREVETRHGLSPHLEQRLPHLLAEVEAFLAQLVARLLPPASPSSL
ncbi:MAG: hydrogenase maturation protease [Thermoanaerobaculum sp.]|nr:hydrogenase maturation protease [Thermoanaerobaculum sp.]